MAPPCWTAFPGEHAKPLQQLLARLKAGAANGNLVARDMSSRSCGRALSLQGIDLRLTSDPPRVEPHVRLSPPRTSARPRAGIDAASPAQDARFERVYLRRETRRAVRRPVRRATLRDPIISSLQCAALAPGHDLAAAEVSMA